MEEDKKELEKDEQRKKWLKIAGGIGIGILLLIVLFKVFSPNNVVISGTIQYNGLSPEDPTKGKVVLLEKELGETDYRTANDNVPLKNDAFWHWEAAQEGTTYNLMAYVEVDGKRIADSNEITITAPAIDQVLVFNVKKEDLPLSVIEGTTVSVSGTLDLNGYIPSGSTVTGFRIEEGSDELIAMNTFPAVDGRSLSWDEAEAGVEYTFIGVLNNSGDVEIGRSEGLVAVAPSKNLVLRIHSTAEAPAEVVSISGKINLRGATEPNSTILMLQRLPGEKDYTSFDRVPAVNGVTWSFADAQNGQQYEITATLQINEQDSALGSVLKVTAPAADEIIYIDTNFSLNPPTSAPVISCENQEEGGKWNAKITYKSIENAAQYWLEAGLSEGGRDLLAERVSASSSDIIRNVLVAEGQDNYTRYAYSYNSGCSEDQCFSRYSPTSVFKCPNN